MPCEAQSMLCMCLFASLFVNAKFPILFFSLKKNRFWENTSPQHTAAAVITPVLTLKKKKKKKMGQACSSLIYHSMGHQV